MRIPVQEAARQIEARGLLKRRANDHSERIIEHARHLLGREPPAELIDFYREGIDVIGSYSTTLPVWDDRLGWRSADELITALLHLDAVPVAWDGFGNLYGLDMTPGVEIPAVYLFDHERDFMIESAAGSSLGAFMMLLAEEDRAVDERWASQWELTIDPDIDRCPRAPASWVGG